LTTSLEQPTTETQRLGLDVESNSADSFTANNMKSRGLLLTATLITILWLAVVVDAYYLSDQEVSVLISAYTFGDHFIAQTVKLGTIFDHTGCTVAHVAQNTKQQEEDQT